VNDDAKVGPLEIPFGRLRIALVAPPYFHVPPSAYGGVEAVVADLADSLVERGHTVHLVGAGTAGTTARFVPVRDQIIPERLGDPFAELVHAAATRRAVRDLAQTEGLDVVHDHTTTGVLNAPSYAEFGLPTVVTAHGPVDGELRDCYALLGLGIDLVAISDRQIELAPDLNWIGRVHNGLRLDSWPFRTDKDEYALFLGRYHPDKAPHLAIDAAHAAGIPIVLAGKCAEPLEKQYFEREVRPRLRPGDKLLGVADGTLKRELLAGARCLLFPVRWEEPFGMVMIEAMACGTPVVALRGGAVAEVLDDGVTGLICDDPAELPAALHRVTALDPAACRARVAGHFGIEMLAAGYEQAYRTAITHRAARAVLFSESLVRLRTEFGALAGNVGPRSTRRRRNARVDDTTWMSGGPE
jgi:glycosyltransferase involved in cell wall biosynthesis